MPVDDPGQGASCGEGKKHKSRRIRQVDVQQLRGVLLDGTREMGSKQGADRGEEEATILRGADQGWGRGGGGLLLTRGAVVVVVDEEGDLMADPLLGDCEIAQKVLHTAVVRRVVFANVQDFHAAEWALCAGLRLGSAPDLEAAFTRSVQHAVVFADL